MGRSRWISAGLLTIELIRTNTHTVTNQAPSQQEKDRERERKSEYREKGMARVSEQVILVGT